MVLPSLKARKKEWFLKTAFFILSSNFAFFCIFLQNEKAYTFMYHKIKQSFYNIFVINPKEFFENKTKNKIFKTLRLIDFDTEFV